MSTKINLVANSKQRGEEQTHPLSQDKKDSVSLCFPDEKQDHHDAQHRDDVQQDVQNHRDDMSQESELSPSIFTPSRASRKRSWPLSQPDSPVFVQAPMAKVARQQDDTFGSSDDTHLSSQGSCAFEEAAQSPSRSFGALSETQSTTTSQHTHHGSESQEHTVSSCALKEKSSMTLSTRPASSNPEIQRVSSPGFSRDNIHRGQSESGLVSTNGSSRAEEGKYPQSPPPCQNREHPPETLCTNLEDKSNQSSDFNLSAHHEHVQNKTSLISTLQEEAAVHPLKLPNQKSITATSAAESNTNSGSIIPSSKKSQDRLALLVTPEATGVNLENSESSKLNPETQSASNRVAIGSFLRSRSPEIQNNGRCQGSEDEDDASMTEVEIMQAEIKYKLGKKRKTEEDDDQIKKGLQEMQVKLRHLSTKQRELRSHLSVKLKQQQAESFSSSNSQSQQQQDARTQLQYMLRRQHHLLKLLQAHKELAAVTLQQIQKADCHDLLPGQASKSSTSTIPEKQKLSNASRAENSVLPTERLDPSSATCKPRLTPPSNSDTCVTNQPRMTPNPSVSKTITSKKSLSDINTGKIFKPPFKAYQARSLSEQSKPRLETSRSANLVMNGPKTTKANPGADQDTLLATAILVEGPSCHSSVEEIHSPPFSPSYGHDTVLSETTGVFRKKRDANPDPTNQTVMKSAHQLPFLNTKGHEAVVNSTVNSNKTSHKNIPEPNRLSTELTVLSTQEDSSIKMRTQPVEKLSVCVPSEPLPKPSLTKQPIKPTAPELNALVNQLLIQLQNRASSTTHHATEANQIPASSKSKKVTSCVEGIPPASQNYQAVPRILTENSGCFRTPSGSVSFMQAPLQLTSSMTKSGTTSTQTETVSNSAQKAPNVNQELFPSRYTNASMGFQTSTYSIGVPPRTHRVLSIPGPNAVSTSILTATSTRCLQEARGTGNVPSLQELLQNGLIKPGVNVLSIKSKNKTVNASIDADGTVTPLVQLKNFSRGSLLQMLSSLKRKSVSSLKDDPRAWKCVSYLGKPLDKLFTDFMALTARKQGLDIQQTFDSSTSSSKLPATPFIQASSVNTQAPSQQNPNSVHQSSTAVFSNDHNLMSVSCNITAQTHCSLAASMRRVLLISDDELIPASCGVSANFWKTENIQETSICPEWIQEMDIWH